MRPWCWLVLLVSCALPTARREAAAQERVPRGAVVGSVVSVEDQRPLAGVSVTLQPVPLGILTPGTGPLPVLLGEGLTATTDSAGTYRFPGLHAGRYRMHVYALGYRPATLEIRLSGWEVSNLSVGLRVATVVLRPIVISVAAGNPYHASSEIGTDAVPVGAVERLRQQRYLPSDVQAVTRADVQQAVSLGESDIFRALQRLPGVSSRDDYTTELWTRGAPWDQTAVYFDGIPLFNPMHAAGAVSAVNPDGVGAVFFHPGVQPAELAGGAAGLVDLRSRRASPDGGQRSAELSLLSARAGADGRLLADRLGWMVAARRSHLDLLALGIRALGGGRSSAIPYRFSDVTGRLDLELGGGRRLEASALYESDHLEGEVSDLVRDTRARWGSAAAQVTLALPLLGGELRHTLGASGSFAWAESGDSAAPGRFPAGAPPVEGPYRAPPVDNAIEHLSFAGSWQSARLPRAAQVQLGYRLVSLSTRFRTTGLWPYRADPGRPAESSQSLRYAVAWAEVEGQLAPRLKAEVGGRVEASPTPLHVSGHFRAAPRLALRYQATPGLSLSAGAAKTIQYAQAVVPAGPGYEGVAFSSLFWRLPGTLDPVLSSDILTAGAEYWMGEGVLLSGTAYARRVRGMGIPDPREGWLDDRPVFVTAEGSSHGLDLAFRKLAGRWTGSAGYGYNVAELEALGLRFPAPTSRKHALDLGAMLRVGGGLRLGGAYTAASGVRATRYEWMQGDCDQEAGCRFLAYARRPGEMEAPGYRSLDLLADWNGTLRALQVGAYAQVRNVLGLDNPAAYTSSQPFCTVRTGETCHPILEIHPDAFKPGRNRYLPGLPFVPSVGVRVTF